MLIVKLPWRASYVLFSAGLQIRTARSQSSQIVTSTGEPSTHREPPIRNAISSQGLPCRCQTVSRKTRIASKASRVVKMSVDFGSALNSDI